MSRAGSPHPECCTTPIKRQGAYTTKHLYSTFDSVMRKAVDGVASEQSEERFLILGKSNKKFLSICKGNL